MAQQRRIDIAWHLRSLSILNAGNPDLPDNQRHRIEAGWGPIRVCAAVRERYDSDTLGRFYTALGTRLYPGHQPLTEDTVRNALTDIALPAALTDAMSTTEYDAGLRDDHDTGASAVGRDDVGTPIISITGTAFFGPVLSCAPHGTAAAHLWDSVHAAATLGCFYELSRGHRGEPSFQHAEAPLPTSTA